MPRKRKIKPNTELGAIWDRVLTDEEMAVLVGWKPRPKLARLKLVTSHPLAEGLVAAWYDGERIRIPKPEEAK
jgi:hypothetical protein